MLDKTFIDGFVEMAALLAVFSIVPAIRYASLESEMMKFIRSPSAETAPLMDMLRERARHLLKAMLGLFSAFLMFFVCRALHNSFNLGTQFFETVFCLIVMMLTGYAAIQLILEIRLTLIAFTYQRTSSKSDG